MNAKYFFLSGWIALAFTLCLMPGPAYWETRIEEHGTVGDDRSDDGGVVEHAPLQRQRSLESVTVQSSPVSTPVRIVQPEPDATSRVLGRLLSEHVKMKERLGHFIPMAGISFCFWQVLLLSRFGLFKRVLLVMGLVLFLAYVIEVLQSLLPVWFSRGFALDDIVVDLAGGLFGLCLCTLWEWFHGHLIGRE